VIVTKTFGGNSILFRRIWLNSRLIKALIF
jgi:hypothetical protein